MHQSKDCVRSSVRQGLNWVLGIQGMVLPQGLCNLEEETNNYTVGRNRKLYEAASIDRHHGGLQVRGDSGKQRTKPGFWKIQWLGCGESGRRVRGKKQFLVRVNGTLGMGTEAYSSMGGCLTCIWFCDAVAWRSGGVGGRGRAEWWCCCVSDPTCIPQPSHFWILWWVPGIINKKLDEKPTHLANCKTKDVHSYFVRFYCRILFLQAYLFISSVLILSCICCSNSLLF